ncbi:MAG: glycosyltransferase family 2 protein [Microcoleus sp. PH2017_29_MFU_D_A]|uniref:glycosyltransferase family 2 protein n=1 Tax=unclassified Microcoleus TaxID=2642155 RepID=UPI001D6610E1|nr:MULTISPECIES: glycosyltransferase family A protein [unclassified Microcoleus]MCC3605032.1 glycosyltransferase family 2 protein [Microcoleus sp. PH2017_29_MFU_D_A]MCC3635993.1 glycosyltransferase family 2 protein [Microcoleus sp. PH2017_37_MFU_D_B]
MNNTKHNLNQPLISVIIPAYNAEEFIAQTIESVLSQTYQNIEILVVDDGSTDTTAEIIKSFAQKDSRIILLQQSNAGVATARNLAYLHSKGEHIAPIDADDIWYPQNLEKQVECLTKSESFVGVIYSWSLDINEEGLLTGGFYNSTIEGSVHDALVYKYFIGNASSSLIRRACFEKVGGYNCKFKLENAQGCEDWELHLRIAQYYQFKVVPEYLVGYRQIASSMSCNYAAMAKGHTLILADVRRQHPEIPSSIYRWSSSNFYIYLAVKSNRSGNHRSTLSWLVRAFKEDLLMALLRHNLYLLSIESILKIIVFSPTKSGLELKKISESSEKMTLAMIESRMKIHRMLPSQVYERMRFNSLTR